MGSRSVDLNMNTISTVFHTTAILKMVVVVVAAVAFVHLIVVDSCIARVAD